MAEAKLSPKHPDWIWLQSPMEQLISERSAPFDAKVSELELQSLSDFYNYEYEQVRSTIK